MTLYTRGQLLVLLVLLAAAGGGLAIGHWRRANPDVVEYLEQLDRPPAAPAVSLQAPQPAGRVRTTRSGPEAEPRRARRSRGTPPTATAAPQTTPSPDTELDDVTDAASQCR